MCIATCFHGTSSADIPPIMYLKMGSPSNSHLHLIKTQYAPFSNSRLFSFPSCKTHTHSHISLSSVSRSYSKAHAHVPSHMLCSPPSFPVTSFERVSFVNQTQASGRLTAVGDGGVEKSYRLRHLVDFQNFTASRNLTRMLFSSTLLSGLGNR